MALKSLNQLDRQAPTQGRSRLFHEVQLGRMTQIEQTVDLRLMYLHFAGEVGFSHLLLKHFIP